MWIGQDGTQFFVNSAQGVSRDAAGDGFVGAWRDGSIPMTLVESELGPDVIPGRVNVRDELARRYAAATGQQEITDSWARSLLRDARRAGFRTQLWHGLVAVTWPGSLDDIIGDLVLTRAEGIVKRCGLNPSSGSGG